MKQIAAELERASHDIDVLLSDIAHNRQAVEERVKIICGQMLVAVRGEGAAEAAGLARRA